MSPLGLPFSVKPDGCCADTLSSCVGMLCESVFPEGCDSSDPQGYQEPLGGVGRSFLTVSLPPSIHA